MALAAIKKHPKRSDVQASACALLADLVCGTQASACARSSARGKSHHLAVTEAILEAWLAHGQDEQVDGALRSALGRMAASNPAEACLAVRLCCKKISPCL